MLYEEESKLEKFLFELADTVIKESKGAYPVLEEKADYIKTVISQEEDRFDKTIDAGLEILEAIIKEAEKEGIKVGLIRPITLWPFPSASYEKYADKVKGFLCVEMSTGQMIEDVKLAINGKNTVDFYGRTGGNVPTQAAILEEVRKIAAKK